MYWKHWNALEVHGGRQSWQSWQSQQWIQSVGGGKTVRTCQNLLGQNGTRLGLLVLLVGPNGDGFGSQAFMEHYSVLNSVKIYR
jgi:hypothetical protein